MTLFPASKSFIKNDGMTFINEKFRKTNSKNILTRLALFIHNYLNNVCQNQKSQHAFAAKICIFYHDLL
jgi:hypothetical protein